MSWRPGEWKHYANPSMWIEDLAARYDESTGKIYIRTDDLNMVYEAGADAMLEALRQRGVHVDNDASFTSVGEHTTLSNKKNIGNYVFIPDDEVKG